MEIRRRPSPPHDVEGLARPASAVPTLSIALTIPLPLAWPRRIHGLDAALPDDVELTCIELAFGDSRGRGSPRRLARRPGRRRAAAIAPLEPPAPVATAPSFATAMRQGAWWQLALTRLRQRTRRLQVLRLLPL